MANSVTPASERRWALVFAMMVPFLFLWALQGVIV